MSELSRETRTLLQRGRTSEPLPPDHRAKLKAAVLANIAAASVATSSTAAVSSVGALSKLVVAAVIGGGLGTATVAGHHYLNPPEPAPVHGSVSGHVSTSQDNLPAAPRTSLVQEPPSTVSARPVARAPLQGPARETSHEQPQEPAPIPEPVQAVSSPPGSSSVPAAASSVSGPARILALKEEARLLREASLFINGGNATSALARLDEHRAKYPAGVLAPERDAQRVIALCLAGRIADARREAVPFLTGNQGPLADRVRASCAGRP